MRLKDWDRNLKIRLFGEGTFNILFWMFFPFMSIYFADAFGKGKAGFLLILSQCFAVIANLMGGYFADQIGRKKMMVWSFFGAGCSFILFALGNSPWVNSPVLSFIAFSLLGIFNMLYWPASHAMVADVVPEKDRNTVFAVFYTTVNIAVVLGPILGSVFFFQYRFQLLLAATITSFIFTFVLHHFLRETLPKKKKLESNVEKKKWYNYLQEQLKSYRVIITDKVFALFILAGILVAQTFMQLDLLIAVYVSEVVPEQTFLNFTLSGKEIFGWLVSENGLLVVLFTVAMTKFMSRYKDKTAFILSSFTYGVGMMMFAHTKSVLGLLFAMLIFTAAELMVVGVQQGFVSKLAPENLRGQYFAAADLRFTVGRTIAPMAILLSSLYGFQVAFYSIAALAFISGFLYSIMFKMMERKLKQPMRVQNSQA